MRKEGHHEKKIASYLNLYDLFVRFKDNWKMKIFNVNLEVSEWWNRIVVYQPFVHCYGIMKYIFAAIQKNPKPSNI